MLWWRSLYLIFASLLTNAADFEFPSGLTDQDVPAIVKSFNSGFLTRTSINLLGLEDYNTQVNFRFNFIDTKKISKLGNGSKKEEVKLQELTFSKKLPLNTEIGLHSSLSIFDRDISSYGGYVRWEFFLTSWGGVNLLGHAASGNYKNVLGTNLYGSSLNIDLNLWSFYFSAGSGFVRTTNTFDPILFGTTDQPAVTYGKLYSHQNVKLSYLWNNFSLTGQLDWVKDFFSSMSISYLF